MTQGANAIERSARKRRRPDGATERQRWKLRVRKMTSDGDYIWGHQQNDFWLNAPDGVAQAVLTRLRLFVGEWYLDVTDGTPWTTQVLDKYTQDQYDAAIRDRILGTPGV